MACFCRPRITVGNSCAELDLLRVLGMMGFGVGEAKSHSSSIKQGGHNYEIESEDGPMTLNVRNCFKSSRRSKDFSLYPQYYCFMLVFGCIGIFIFVMTVIGLNFWDE
ncbi:killer cell lectin-like receptor subfamily F member 2 [Lemur catta]|uniref:killer cell lectin-like receptor subfamily F member 2 n=1 Tax=Lemur catta TaxID=9447 RepID=UPI001E2673E7|nr:killer cell lectin-like receptor subfamily F member 2 [Lemur catta]